MGKPQYGTLNIKESLLGLAAFTEWSLWDLATGTRQQIWSQPDEAAWVECLALSPDGSNLATSKGYYPAIPLWDTATGSLRQELVFDDEVAEVTSMAFSPDGQLLAEGSYHADVVRLWHVGKGQLLHRWEFARSQGSSLINETVAGLAFSPDGRWLACGVTEGYASYDAFDRMIRLWDVQLGEPLGILGTTLLAI